VKIKSFDKHPEERGQCEVVQQRHDAFAQPLTRPTNGTETRLVVCCSASANDRVGHGSIFRKLNPKRLQSTQPTLIITGNNPTHYPHWTIKTI